MTQYLLVRAATFHLLIEAALIETVDAPAVSGELDLSRALGAGPAELFIRLVGAARASGLGVDAVAGLITLADVELAPLPPLVAAAAGEDIDAVTRGARDGAHAFRLRLRRSIAAAAR